MKVGVAGPVGSKYPRLSSEGVTGLDGSTVSCSREFSQSPGTKCSSSESMAGSGCEC